MPQEPSPSWQHKLIRLCFQACLLWILAVPLFYSKVLIDTSLIHRWWLIMALSVLALVNLGVQQAPQSRIRGQWLALLAAVPICMVFSAAISGRWLTLWPDLSLSLQLLICAYLFYICIARVTLDRFLLLAAYYITIIASAIAFIGIAQTYGLNLLDLPVVRLPGSTLADRPFAAEYVVAVFPWIALALYQTEKRIPSLLIMAALAMQFYYLLLLRGRAGYLAFALGLLFICGMTLIAYREKIVWKKLIGQVGVGLTLLAIIALLARQDQSLLPRPSFQKTVSNMLDSGNSRIWYWTESARMIQQHPIIGTGPMSWSSEFALSAPEQFLDQHINHVHLNPHNDYLEHWTENGLPGLVCFSLFTLIPLFILTKAGFTDKRMLFVATSAFCLIIASNFSFTKDRTAPMIIAMLNLAVALHVANYGRSSKGINWSRFPYRLIIFLGACLLLVYTSIRLQSEHHYLRAIAFKFHSQYELMNQEMQQINTRIYPLDPNEVPIDYYHAVGLFKQKQFKQALLKTEQALLLQPNLPTIKQNYAASLFKLGQLADAASYFEGMKQQYPNYFAPQLNLVAVYTETKQYHEAANILLSIEKAFYNYTQQESVFHEYSYSFSFIKNVRDNPTYLKMKEYYAKNHPEALFKEGLFKYPKESTVYLYEAGHKRKIESASAFAGRGYQWENVITLPETIFFPNGQAIK